MDAMAKKPAKTAAKPVKKLAPKLDPKTIAPLSHAKGANAAQMASPSYKLAALDQDWLLSDINRGVRFMLEYAKVEEALDRWGVRSTIVVFGSARIREDGPEPHPRWYAAAREFAAIASKRCGYFCSVVSSPRSPSERPSASDMLMMLGPGFANPFSSSTQPV